MSSCYAFSSLSLSRELSHARLISGYINRLRGYHGLSVKTSFYGSRGDRLKHHVWSNVNLDTYAKEWPDAWIAIDTDVAPSKIDGTF